MSYDIYIGEATVEDNGEGSIRAVVLARDEPEAPTFDGDEMTGSGNHRHPGYSQWVNWCDAVRLCSLFFDKNTGLMRDHPGTFALNQDHANAVSETTAKWLAAHPNATPGFGVGQDPMYARLIWLEWWMKWALANCAIPAIHNC